MARRKRKGQTVAKMYSGFGREDMRRDHKRADDPRTVVISARQRHNCKPCGYDVDIDMWGDMAGRAIIIGADDMDEARALWDMFKAVDAADERYFRRIIGRSRFPSVSKMEYLPEPFETGDDANKGKYQTEEEKDRSAKLRWMEWQERLLSLSETDHCAIVSAMRHRVLLSHAGKLTGNGVAFVKGMRALDLAARTG